MYFLDRPMQMTIRRTSLCTRERNMVSLGKALQAREAAEFEEALERSISLLAEGIALHAVCDNESEYSQFQKIVRNLQARLSEAHGDGRETLVVTGALLHALSRYNSDITRWHTAAINELRRVAGMLTGASSMPAKGGSAPRPVCGTSNGPSKRLPPRTTFAW